MKSCQAFLVVVACLTTMCLVSHGQAAGVHNCSVLVYGSTPAGLCAAIAAARQLKDTQYRVCVLSPHAHVGGMVTGGLGKTDTGGARGEALIGGIAGEFFREVGRLYGKSEAVFLFEPSIASKAFQNLLEAANVTIAIRQHVAGVEKAGTGSVSRVTSLTTSSGDVYSSEVFIDATYEGDLMALADVAYTVGREGMEQYNESLAGRQEYSPLNQFYVAVDPVNATSHKPLHFVSDADPGAAGQADKKVSAYNLRLCLTRNTSNHVEITEPTGYNPDDWELVRRYAKSPPVNDKPGIYHFLGIGEIPNGKSDTNNAGPMSTDFIGASWTYPEASPAERQQIIIDHYLYTHQLLWFLGHDPEINATIREQMLQYGLCADEHPFNEWYEPHWPPQLYVREARRMVGPYVFTEASARGSGSTGRGVNSIGCGSYNFDAHNVQRYPCHPGTINCVKSSSETRRNPCCRSASGAGESHPSSAGSGFAVLDEGDVEVNPGPFEIPYDVLLPDIDQAANMLVPGAVSASHIGFSCLRLEPQWMIVGHSAGTAAALVVKSETKSPVQQLDRSLLHAELAKEKQILEVRRL